MHYLARSVGTYLGRAQVLEIIMQSHLWAKGQKFCAKFEFFDTMLHITSIGISQGMQPRTPVREPLL